MELRDYYTLNLLVVGLNPTGASFLCISDIVYLLINKGKKMNRLLILLSMILLVVGCNQDSQINIKHAVDAAPEHYKVEFENEYVRVIRVTYNPGETSVMHSHKPLVGVTLTGGQGKFTDPDGNVETRSENFAGDILSDSGEAHSVHSISKGYEELIFVEAKKKYPSKGSNILNAALIDSMNSNIELEEHGIRVIRTTAPAGGESPMHSHGAGVAVSLTDQKTIHTSQSGEVTEVNLKAGSMSWRGEVTHSGKNINDTDLEVILFELM